uniref:Nocturnin n=1 Tax=Petromyzon marinus TaxID=7757 RepID=S4RDH5_PETMA|nr:nocturnin [Petromyzon marinus]
MGSVVSRAYEALVGYILGARRNVLAVEWSDHASSEAVNPVDGTDAEHRLLDPAKVSSRLRLGREFVPVEGLDPSPPTHSFRIMQWNVLAQALGEGKDNFVCCRPADLTWAARWPLILDEIVSYQPDLICLQEVDRYHDAFSPALNQLGYGGAFVPKRHSPCLDVQPNYGPDGCAIFYRKERFELLGGYAIGLRAEPIPYPTHQVLLVLKLCYVDTGHSLTVACTHLKARQGWERLRAAQAKHLLTCLNSDQEAREGPLVVCGDFNAKPAETVHQLFAASALGLSSAYRKLSEDGQTEPPFTTWTVRAGGETQATLDYIWYSQNALRVEQLLNLPSERDIGSGRLPSSTYPSDHLSLVCDFSFVGDTHAT